MVTRVMPTVVVVTGLVAVMMAFLVFGKRRRDQEPTASDSVLGAAAARGSGLIAGSGLVPAMAGGAVPAMAGAAPSAMAGGPVPAMTSAAMAASAVQALSVAPGPSEVDGHLPRWRRPSLMEARKADPLRSASPTSAAAPHLVFEGAVGTAVTGLERRRVRYRLVSLLSDPDEVRGREIGVLDDGDEVVLMEKRGLFRRVLCPDGREGWVHKMVLGDVVNETPAAGAGTWATVDDGSAIGGFEDMLRAFSERREGLGES
jgi:hypothetical protein